MATDESRLKQAPDRQQDCPRSLPGRWDSSARLRHIKAADEYSAQVDSAEEWTVERHLADKPKAVADLYKRFVRLLRACGPHTLSVTKTAITFKGSHRGFAGAKPRKTSLDGFLDLQREVKDERFLRVSPYTKSLYVHQFRIISAEQLDASFSDLIEEAYQVGCGAHRPPRRGADCPVRRP